MSPRFSGSHRGLTLAVWLCLGACGDARADATALQNGDLVFQESTSRQSRAIRAVTGSRYTHVGVVMIEGGRTLVLEAVEPVKRTPLSAWIARGKDRHYVAMRLKDAHERLTPTVVTRLVHEADALMGRQYDLVFGWDDRRLYCSEFAWKVFRRAVGIEIGRPQRWRDLDLSSPAAQRLMRQRLSHPKDPEEFVVTPARMMSSPLLVEVARSP